MVFGSWVYRGSAWCLVAGYGGVVHGVHWLGAEGQSIMDTCYDSLMFGLSIYLRRPDKDFTILVEKVLVCGSREKKGTGLGEAVRPVEQGATLGNSYEVKGRSYVAPAWLGVC